MIPVLRSLCVTVGIIAFTACVLPASAQHTPSRIEITPYARFDRYPAFFYAINSINTNEVKLRGNSWGVNAAYKFPVMENTWLKAGAGYYKYAFNKIKTTSSYGESNARNINYPSILDLLFRTDNYSYHTVVLTLGAEKGFPLSGNMQVMAGIALNNHLTFSQYYHIDYYNASNPIENDYKRSGTHYFAFSAELQAGLQHTFGRCSLGPRLIVPVFDNWKQDDMFPGESRSGSRNKWLGGIGAGIVFGYSL